MRVAGGHGRDSHISIAFLGLKEGSALGAQEMGGVGEEQPLGLVYAFKTCSRTERTNKSFLL